MGVLVSLWPMGLYGWPRRLTGSPGYFCLLHPPLPTSDDARPYVLFRGKQFEVPKAYPKGAEGPLVNNQQFIQELEKYFVKDIRDACARNNNLCAKPRSSHMKSDLIYKRVFADFL